MTNWRKKYFSDFWKEITANTHRITLHLRKIATPPPSDNHSSHDRIRYTVQVHNLLNLGLNRVKNSFRIKPNWVFYIILDWNFFIKFLKFGNSIFSTLMKWLRKVYLGIFFTREKLSQLFCHARVIELLGSIRRRDQLGTSLIIVVINKDGTPHVWNRDQRSFSRTRIAANNMTSIQVLGKILGLGRYF